MRGRAFFSVNTSMAQRLSLCRQQHRRMYMLLQVRPALSSLGRPVCKVAGACINVWPPDHLVMLWLTCRNMLRISFPLSAAQPLMRSLRCHESSLFLATFMNAS